MWIGTHYKYLFIYFNLLIRCIRVELYKNTHHTPTINNSNDNYVLICHHINIILT